MTLVWPFKDPDEVLDYTLDWSARLDEDTIASSTWTVPVGITMGETSFSDTVTKIWISGGASGNSYNIVNRVTTAAGRTMDQSVKLKLKDK